MMRSRPAASSSSIVKTTHLTHIRATLQTLLECSDSDSSYCLNASRYHLARLASFRLSRPNCCTLLLQSALPPHSSSQMNLLPFDFSILQIAPVCFESQ